MANRMASAMANRMAKVMAKSCPNPNPKFFFSSVIAKPNTTVTRERRFGLGDSR